MIVDLLLCFTFFFLLFKWPTDGITLTAMPSILTRYCDVVCLCLSTRCIVQKWLGRDRDAVLYEDWWDPAPAPEWEMGRGST